MDDRICMHYVVDRLEDIISYNSCQLDGQDEVRDCVRKEMLEKFKHELIYNLGVNQRIKYHE
jgi:hypothetical protein